MERRAKTIENEELVKYMSSLPSYLEKGGNLRDKAFNVGVLDWRFLEKWRHKHACSPSSSNTVSASSSYSSRAKSCSPIRHRSFDEDPRINVQEICDSRRTSRVRGSLDVETGMRTLSSKGKMKIQDRACLSESSYRFDDFSRIEKPKSAVLRVPEPRQETNSCTTSCPPDSVERDQRPVKQSRRSFSCGFISAFYHEGDGQRQSKMGQASSIDSNDTSSSSNTIRPSAYPTKDGMSETTKVRNPSPTRRFSMVMGRILKEQSDSNKAEISSSVYRGCDKADTTDRARTSPLRRLLDPLLKPKAGSTEKLCKASTKRGESPTKRLAKIKLDLKGCKAIDIGDPCSNGTSVIPSTLQALLQVAVKNGVPLFTFAVDNEVDVLAATMKKLSSTLKEPSCSIYTFFTIRETKKKSGSWLNQVGKDRSHGIMPNIVGKMKVSDRQKLGNREFVLFPADAKPNDELAAIVVRLPNRSDHEDSNYHNNSGFRLPNASEDFSMTVILPGGAHGLPGKGEPSSLIERWKSGGSCDCGGWDLGCKIRLLVNQTYHRTISGSAKPELKAERFELLSQDSKPVFSLSPFKDGIFSVEFSSSLKLLQAFSICIAVLNSRIQETFQEKQT